MHIAGKETRALRRESRRLSFRSVAVDEVLCRVRSVYTHLPKLRWVSCLADADVRNQARQSRSCFFVLGGVLVVKPGVAVKPEAGATWAVPPLCVCSPTRCHGTMQHALGLVCVRTTAATGQ
jgi:hypothetical protein